MILPENISDETLEYAARLVEESSITDWRGAISKRKRDREDAELRQHARQELRVELAAQLRAMTSRKDLSAATVLARFAEREDSATDDVVRLRDAWPLAWKGWVDIIAELHCASNWVPPRVHYRIRLTDKGRAVLASGVEVADPDLHRGGR